jgi:hypothetical protein
MSLHKENDGTIHLAGDTVETLLLALCCLEAMWTEYPDIVKMVAIESGMPEIASKGGEARMLITALMALK